MSEEQNVTTEEIVNDWDSIIIQINNGIDGCGSIRMMKQDIESMMELHGVDRGWILDMCLKAAETTPKEHFEPKQ